MGLGYPSVPPFLASQTNPRGGGSQPNKGSIDTEEVGYPEWARPCMLSMLIVPPPTGHSFGNHKDLDSSSFNCLLPAADLWSLQPEISYCSDFTR